MITQTKHILLSVTLATIAILFAGPAAAQISRVSLEDGSAHNDTGSGPTSVNNGDFIEVRNHPATRKRIGYWKYDITGIDPVLFSTATLSGLFHSGRNGEGPIVIYGLNDGEDNLDDVMDGSFNEENWTDGTLSYSMGLGVDTSVAPDTVGVDAATVGIDLTEVAELGVMNSIADDDVFLTNTTDAPLGDFLAADTNGVVTFIMADIRDQSIEDNTTEWRLTSRESSEADSVKLLFHPTPGDTDLDFVVELEDDLNPIRMNFNMAGSYTDGDLNDDGIVGYPDFRIWKTAYLAAGGSLAGVDLGFLSVPEPATALLVLIGMIGMQATYGRRGR